MIINVNAWNGAANRYPRCNPSICLIFLLLMPLLAHTWESMHRERIYYPLVHMMTSPPEKCSFLLTEGNSMPVASPTYATPHYCDFPQRFVLHASWLAAVLLLKHHSLTAKNAWFGVQTFCPPLQPTVPRRRLKQPWAQVAAYIVHQWMMNGYCPSMGFDYPLVLSYLSHCCLQYPPLGQTRLHHPPRLLCRCQQCRTTNSHSNLPACLAFQCPSAVKRQNPPLQPNHKDN